VRLAVSRVLNGDRTRGTAGGGGWPCRPRAARVDARESVFLQNGQFTGSFPFLDLHGLSLLIARNPPRSTAATGLRPPPCG
jgi:hypothetical protein